MADDQAPPPAGPPPPAVPFTREELKAALKAFNRRMRLTRLDDESRLGHGAMTGGMRSGIVAIRPPNQFPKEMWDELVRLGKLKYAGQGLYESDRLQDAIKILNKQKVEKNIVLGTKLFTKENADKGPLEVRS